MRRRGRPFYGWWIVAAAVLSQYAYSIQFNANYGVYVYTMGAEMGWSRTALSAVQSVGRVPEGIFGVLLGPTVDRHGARWIVGIGALVMGFSLIALASVEELWQLYLYRGILMSAGGVCVGGFASVTVANWFRVKRGRALAISSAGASLGNATLPLITAFLIAARGWRESWAIQGIAIMVLAIPAVVTFRRRPEDVGLRPDGLSAEAMSSLSERQQAREREMARADVVWTRGHALGPSAFWYTAVALRRDFDGPHSDEPSPLPVPRRPRLPCDPGRGRCELSRRASSGHCATLGNRDRAAADARGAGHAIHHAGGAPC